nr:crooked neck-like protein 1 [Tanacetum cinerariifolium]
VKFPRPIRVKNKTPAPVQITSGQFLREDRERQEAEIRPPKQKITDTTELADYRLRNRKEFEDKIRRARWNLSNWVKYAKWEESQKDFNRARSVWERALDVDYRDPSMWLKFVDMEMKNKFINHARNESVGNKQRIREVYERAIANVPPVDEKRYWQRYIYLWINYVLYEEFDAQDVPRTRDVYHECLKLIPYKKFSFAKVWILAVEFQIRQLNLSGARAVLGNAIGMAPKDKIFKKYIEIELQLGNIDHCRKLYEKYLEWSPENFYAWSNSEAASYKSWYLSFVTSQTQPLEVLIIQSTTLIADKSIKWMKRLFLFWCIELNLKLHRLDIIPAIKTVYPSAEHRYCLQHIHENIKHGWCGQTYKDLLWRAASDTNVRDFEKCRLEHKTINAKAHEWLNKIPTKHWARSHFLGRAKSDLLLNNICEVFNGKIVGGRDKPVISLLEFTREYCMKRIMNVQGVIDKCTGPFTPTATRIMESIKKEAYLMKVQWNGANKKWELTGIPCKHAIAGCWNMALNDRAAPPSETWVNPYYWSSTWKETYSHKKRKRSKHEDEPFVKNGKLSRKGRTITCQSCGNTGHNKATCKGLGGNNAEASGSASRQVQQTEPIAGQDGSGGSYAGAVIGLFIAAGEGGQGGTGVARQGSSHSRWTKSRVQTERISPQKRTPTQTTSQPSTSSQVPLSKTRIVDGREKGDGVPTQSSAAVSDNGNFPMVNEEEVTSKKLAPMAEEMIMLIEFLKRNCIKPSDNRKFMMVDGEDLHFKKISPMAEENLEMLRVCVAKKIKGLGGGGYLRDYVRVVAETDDGGNQCLDGGGYLRDYVEVVAGMDDGG